MCGRFTLTVPHDLLVDAFPGIDVPEDMAPRYNIAPTQPVAVIANNRREKIEFFQWGLITSWAKDPKIGNRMINARAETLSTKPSFRTAFKRRRCLIVADGFYEWWKRPGERSKTPIYIRMKSGEPFAFAGLWEAWQSPEGEEVLSCTIITTEANELLEQYHHRMPVILNPRDYDRWLDPLEQNPETFADLLRPYPALEMIVHPVSTFVNSPLNDSSECIVPDER